MREPIRTLLHERYINLATFRKNREAVETPVWFAEHRGKLYVLTAGDSGKVKRLRNSSRARIAPCDLRGRVHGDWVDVKAGIIEDPSRREQAHRALRLKYGVQMWAADLGARLSGRIKRRAFLEIEVP